MGPVIPYNLSLCLKLMVSGSMSRTRTMSDCIHLKTLSELKRPEDESGSDLLLLFRSNVPILLYTRITYVLQIVFKSP